jgi:hypothetical protein
MTTLAKMLLASSQDLSTGIKTMAVKAIREENLLDHWKEAMMLASMKTKAAMADLRQAEKALAKAVREQHLEAAGEAAVERRRLKKELASLRARKEECEAKVAHYSA